MAFKINVSVDGGEVHTFEVDVDPTKVQRVSVNKNSGEVASVGSPYENDFLNLIIYTRPTAAQTGEEQQAAAAAASVVEEPAPKTSSKKSAKTEEKVS